MDAFWISAGVVALGEMGDKTQLLAMLLAARFRRPLPVVAGILVATLVNHLGAAALGSWVASVLGPKTLRWGVAASFAAMALWMLVPDRIDDDGTQATPRWGAFGTTVVAFFLAEMGDKTQIATVALAARFDSLLAVVAGSTCGILLADAPVVFLGGALVRKLSMRWVHRTCAAVFALLSVLTVLGADTWW